MTLYGASETILKYLYIKDKRRTQCPHFTRTQGTSRNISIRNGLHYLYPVQRSIIFIGLYFQKERHFLGLYNIHKIENPAGGLGFSALIFLPPFSFFSGADY